MIDGMSAIFDGSGPHSEDNSTNHCTTIFVCHEYFNNDIELLIFQSCYVVGYLRCFHFSWDFHFLPAKFVACWLFFQLSILFAWFIWFDCSFYAVFDLSPLSVYLFYAESLHLFMLSCIQIFNCEEYEQIINTNWFSFMWKFEHFSWCVMMTNYPRDINDFDSTFQFCVWCSII